MAFKTPWLALAVSSGACAAINGVFAKLTTTELTSSWSSSISLFLHLSATNKFIEFAIRGIFFLLNLAFNALMWALFTAALTRASSTTRVSVINTSSNFMLTAVLGWMIFRERLPPLWWVGGAGLVVGTVIIGRRGEEGEGDNKRGLQEDTARVVEGEEYRDQPAERLNDDVLELDMDIGAKDSEGENKQGTVVVKQ
ncbi:MAG: hypothetical protein LQ342_004947 [Letrouitia transgressa]|nr:MAG: hypothetical protein LQ342_004947 [Letrouitia transgressa]